MTAVSSTAAAVPAASTGAAANQLNPQLVALVQQLPADQQAAAMQQLAALSPAQQTQLLQQVSAQAQAQQQAGAAPSTAGADQATLGASATGAATTPSLFKTLAKNALIFGGIGAALGFGASFLPNPLMGITLPGAPILAAIGGGIGAVVGLVKGFLSYKKQAAAAAATAQTAQTPDPSAAGQLQPVPGTAAATPTSAPAPTPDPAPAPAPAKKHSSGGGYTVKKGDTLGKIAKAHGMSWQALYKLNKQVVGSNPNLIFPGQKLVFS